MRAKKENIAAPLSRLIPKNHFVSMSFFREEPLIKWPYTESVLFTAYDVYRSSDFWIDSCIKSGQTLKEGLLELGFPERCSLVADTGIFEIEARKAGIAKRLGIDVDFSLTNEQIFEAYELSGADVFVSPDEIILPTDAPYQVVSKVSTIKENLLQLLDTVPASKVIAVLQGSKRGTIERLYDFFRSNKVRMFAMGGLLPMWHHDPNLLKRVVTYARSITKGYWLHTFGLPRLKLLTYYLHDLGVDSVDSSILLYLTARRRYVAGTDACPVRLVDLSVCDCEGCKNLDSNMHTRSYDFFVNLYIHNVIEAAKMSRGIPANPDDPRIRKESRTIEKQDKKKRKDSATEKNPMKSISWQTAEDSLRESESGVQRRKP